MPITELTPGDIIYVDIRTYGYEWYRQMRLPDKDTLTYVTRVAVTGCSTDKRGLRNKLMGRAELYRDPPVGAIVLNQESIQTYPQLDHDTYMSAQFEDPVIDAPPKPAKTKYVRRKKGGRSSVTFVTGT
jgi:hypothetical protein